MESYENFKRLIPLHESLSLGKIDQLYQIVIDAYDEGLKTYQFDYDLYMDTEKFFVYNKLGYLVDNIIDEVEVNDHYEIIIKFRDNSSPNEICKRYYLNGEIAEQVDGDPNNWKLFMMKSENGSYLGEGYDYLKKV